SYSKVNVHRQQCLCHWLSDLVFVAQPFLAVLPEAMTQPGRKRAPIFQRAAVRKLTTHDREVAESASRKLGFYGRSLSSYSSGTSSCGTSCVRTSPRSASGASSTPLTIPASNVCPSSSNSSALSESAPSTTETPPKSPPPAPAAAVRARRFNRTVSTLWLPSPASVRRAGLLRPAGLRAAFCFGAPFFALNFALALAFVTARRLAALRACALRLDPGPERSPLRSLSPLRTFGLLPAIPPGFRSRHPQPRKRRQNPRPPLPRPPCAGAGGGDFGGVSVVEGADS